MRIYLDVCCLERPFDDQAVDRNRLEAEAVLTVLERVRQGNWELVGSRALEWEIDLNRAEDRRDQTRAFLSMQSRFVRIGPGELDRMDELALLGFKALDALHAACAESGGCDVLLTTDDKFLKRARRLQARLRVRVENPLTWMQERLDDERGTDDAE